jgi:hypothetical protein
MHVGAGRLLTPATSATLRIADRRRQPGRVARRYDHRRPAAPARSPHPHDYAQLPSRDVADLDPGFLDRVDPVQGHPHGAPAFPVARPARRHSPSRCLPPARSPQMPGTPAATSPARLPVKGHHRAAPPRTRFGSSGSRHRAGQSRYPWPARSASVSEPCRSAWWARSLWRCCAQGPLAGGSASGPLRQRPARGLTPRPLARAHPPWPRMRPLGVRPSCRPSRRTRRAGARPGCGPGRPR